ncbi:MAG TPA: TrkA C-terminal domain-containing protein [Longimicrobiales bacterium]|nr:TrkA C-terminal domain-containing protein [Longimicrobiales bacterium]
METERYTVKDLLVEAKDAAELMVDVAYGAVFFNDPQLAEEVLDLEDRIGDVLYELRLVCMLAARTREDAEGLAGVLSLAESIEAIADAAEEIARVVLKNLGVPPQLREDLRHAEEIIGRVTIQPENEMEGLPLDDLGLPFRTGMWVIAVRRGVEWKFAPDGSEILLEGDVLLLQGPPEGLDPVRKMAGDLAREPEPQPSTAPLSNLDRAVDLVIELKNTSEIAVGLAYASILLQDKGLAGEVRVIEERSDELYHQLETWVLRAAAEAADPEQLRGLIHISNASERIVDAARSMTRLAESDAPPHPIIAHALAEADEIVAEALVAEGSEAAGRSLGELKLHTETGMEVLANERRGRWMYRPRSRLVLEAGDRLLAIGPEDGAPLLRAICGDTRPAGEQGWHQAPGEEDL